MFGEWLEDTVIMLIEEVGENIKAAISDIFVCK